MSNLHKGGRIITHFPLSFQTLIRQLGGIINQDMIGVFYQHMISHVQSEGSRLVWLGDANLILELLNQ